MFELTSYLNYFRTMVAFDNMKEYPKNW